MPLYEYICTSCTTEFEELQKFSEPPLKKCPTCQQFELKKKVSKTDFKLLGSGWFKDGYK